MNVRLRATSIAIASGLVLSLAACTSGSTASAPKSDGPAHWQGSAKATKDLVFGTSVKVGGVNWFIRMEKGVKSFGAEKGLKAFLQGPSIADTAQQIQVTQDMLAQGVDALIVVPMEVPPMEPILKQAMKSGVVVITHEASKVTNAVYDIEAFDNAKYGENLMKNLADRTGKTGQYAMSVGSLNSTAQVEWMDAAVAYQKKNYPNMKLVGDYLISESNIDKSYSEAKQTLQRYPNIVGFIGGDAGDVLGAGRAVLEAGLKDKVTVLGTSIVSYAGPLMKSGAIDMISTWDPAQAGYVANLVALKVIQGKKISTGDDLGVDGFHKVTVKGKVIYGDAWVEITLKNMADYNF